MGLIKGDTGSLDYSSNRSSILSCPISGQHVVGGSGEA